MMRLRQRAGMTLIELIAALSVLGTIAGISTLALRSAGPVDMVDEATARVRDARREALRLRRPVSIEIRVDGTLRRATAMPDGRIIGDAAIGGHRMTGNTDVWE